MFYHAMTVLLEYITHSMKFSKILILLLYYVTIAYYAGIMLNAFNGTLCSKLCWHDRWVLTHIK